MSINESERTTLIEYRIEKAKKATKDGDRSKGHWLVLSGIGPTGISLTDLAPNLPNLHRRGHPVHRNEFLFFRAPPPIIDWLRNLTQDISNSV